MRTKTVGLKDVLQLIKESALAWNNDSAASMGAAIAYYTIFSIAPLLIIAIAIAGFFSASKPPEAKFSPRPAA